MPTCLQYSSCPISSRGIVMRVRDGDRAQPTQTLDLRDRLIVDQTHTVSEDIALWMLNQQRSLANRKRRLRSNANQPRLMFAKLVAQAILPHLRQCRPLLTLIADILALIVTDRARCGWSFARGELCATCLTDPLFHL